jgi:hypothetical protein
MLNQFSQNIGFMVPYKYRPKYINRPKTSMYHIAQNSKGIERGAVGLLSGIKFVSQALFQHLCVTIRKR